MHQKTLLLNLPLFLTASLTNAASETRTYVDANVQVASVRADLEVPGLGSDSGNMTLYGGALGAGVYFGDGARWGKGSEFDNYFNVGVHQAGVEIGLLGGDKTESVAGISAKESYLMAPILAVYNYNFILPENYGLIYVGPSIGTVVLNTKLSAPGFSESDTAAAFAGGFQAGAKFVVGRNLMIQAGYRLLASGAFDYDFAGVEARLKNPVSHTFNFGVAYVY